MMRAFVTGADGFLGRNVVAALREDGWSVARGVRSLASIDPTSLDVEIGTGAVEMFRQALSRLEPDVVFHLVGRSSGPLYEVYQANCVFAANLIEAARLIKPHPLIVLTGSAAEYGRVGESDLPVTEDHICKPISAYGISKYAQTLTGLAAAEAGGAVIIARVFNLIGRGMPDHLALGSFAKQLRSGQSANLRVGNLDVERDFIDVAEAARLMIALALSPQRSGSVYNICSGRPARLRPLVEALVRCTGLGVAITTDATRFRPDDIVRFYGSTARLEAVGLNSAEPDFARLLSEVLAGPDGSPG